ncbi:MAG: AAA family ATPase [Saprospiraceae bacterium]
MLTKVTIENFKKLDSISFPLEQSVVLIGPNNAGKTTVFQAFCLWEIGVKSFLRAKNKNDLNNSGGVTINRHDLLNSPISDARFLWRNRKVKIPKPKGGGEHIKLSVQLEGENLGKPWSCKAEFVFSNAESFTCKVITGYSEINQLYKNGQDIRFGFLQPMSGIATTEDKLTAGSIDRKLGEGRTAEVMRNICYEILYPETPKALGYNGEANWKSLATHIHRLFGARLKKPEFIRSTGLVELQYEENGNVYDVSSGGRGFQQTLLLLSFLYAHPNTILLLDEPDAHLEVIRQREIFQILTQTAEEVGSQIIIASHSEVVLNEASEVSKIIALIENTAIEINDKHIGREIRKALIEIGWEKYYLAKLKKHILFLEGTTDLSMLLAFSTRLKHPIEPLLRQANVDYVSTNAPHLAVQNFVALKSIFPELSGLALFDRLPNEKMTNPKLKIICWKRRELENYFAKPSVLYQWAKDLATRLEKDAQSFDKTMHEIVSDNTLPRALRDQNDTFWVDEKLTDNWLDRIFADFFSRHSLSPSFFKNDYHFLISLLSDDEIDPEIKEKLDILQKFLEKPVEKH